VAGGKLSPKKVELEIRRKAALQLRVARHSFRDIAELLKEAAKDPDNAAAGLVVPETYGNVQARRDVLAAIHATVKDREALAMEYLGIHLEHFNALIGALLPRAEKGDLGAIEEIRVLMADERQMLGVNAAKQVKVGGIKDAPVEVKQTGGAPDLSGLTDEELDLYVALARKTARPAGGDTGAVDEGAGAV